MQLGQAEIIRIHLAFVNERVVLKTKRQVCFTPLYEQWNSLLITGVWRWGRGTIAWVMVGRRSPSTNQVNVITCLKASGLRWPWPISSQIHSIVFIARDSLDESAGWFDTDAIVMVFGISSSSKSPRTQAFEHRPDELPKRSRVYSLKRILNVPVDFFLRSKFASWQCLR